MCYMQQRLYSHFLHIKSNIFHLPDFHKKKKMSLHDYAVWEKDKVRDKVKVKDNPSSLYNGPDYSPVFPYTGIIPYQYNFLCLCTGQHGKIY